MPAACRHVLVLTGSIALACAMMVGQSRKTEDLATGKVLVMQREAPDPVFAESVILLIHYDADGVMGVMLNQPADVPLSRLHELPGTSGRSDPVYAGGPVELGAVTALIRTGKAPPEAIHVTGDLYAIQTRKGLDAAIKASKGPADFRLYLGYCGWTTAQLQNEMKLESWYIFDQGDRLAFDTEPATLWKRLIERTGGQLVFAPRSTAQARN